MPKQNNQMALRGTCPHGKVLFLSICFVLDSLLIAFQQREPGNPSTVSVPIAIRRERTDEQTKDSPCKLR
jgi:hypothetical protein